MDDEGALPESGANANTDEGGSDDAENGQVLRCSGPELICQPRAVNALAYAYSRTGLDVKGPPSDRRGSYSHSFRLVHYLPKKKVGSIILEKSMLITTPKQNAMSCQTLWCCLKMLNKIADLQGWGWGELSSQNLAESVRSVASEGIHLSQQIYSLGIPMVGTGNAHISISSINICQRGFMFEGP
ncbi:LOW QUALITY PROTEIN: hypothetical protein ACHAXR_006976 [Thalassiosira sp. AJA248-18]